MKLFKHQTDFLIQNPNKHALIWGTGSGKTLTSILWAQQKGGQTLVIVPKGLKTQWHRQVPENFHVLTKEEFKKYHKSAVRYQNVIVDEAHYFLGMKSALSKALHAFLKATKPNILMLTATPYRSSPWDVYRLLELLDHPTRPSYWRFSTQCFSQVRMGGRMIPVQRKGLEPILAEYIRQVASIVKLEDCIDVPDQIHEVEYFSLTEEQNDAIAASYDPLPIVRFTKIHQICGGTLKGDEYNDSQIFISEKLARMIELVESNPRMIVVCRYKSELRMLHEYFKQAKPKLLNGLIDGDVSGPEREAILSSFRNKDSYVLFVNASCAEGWELSDCPLMVFYSMDFSLLREIQMRGRIQRINNIKKNTYLYLVVEGTIDEDIYECVTVKKRDFHLAIYEKEGDKR